MRIIKLDVDDIMEILLEYYQEQFQNSEYSKGMFLGMPGKELRFIAVFGSENDENLKKINLEELDKIIDYNGEHAFLKNNPDFLI